MEKGERRRGGERREKGDGETGRRGDDKYIYVVCKAWEI